jgi:hypothetical protein
MQSIGAGNTPAQRRTCARVDASPPRLHHAPQYHDRASKSRRVLGVRQPRTHLQGPPWLVSPRATPRARAHRGAVGLPAAHECQGRSTHALKRWEGLAPKWGATACASAIKGHPFSARAWALPPAEPPLPPPPRARTPASSRRRPNPPSPYPCHPQAPMAATWSSPPRTSLEPEHPRARRHDLTAAARQSHLWPCNHHQSPQGEPNHTLVPFVCQDRPCLTAGELPPTGKGTIVNRNGMVVNLGTRLQ